MTLPEEIQHQRLIKRAPESDRQWYGFEFYSTNNMLKRWTLKKLTEAAKASPHTEIHALDIGGASGFWAMKLAKGGAQTTIIDMNPGDHVTTIAERNRLLAHRPGQGRIAFNHGDIRALDGHHILDRCEGRKPSIVTGFHLLHFLDDKDLPGFFHSLRQSSSDKAIVALQYKTPLTSPKIGFADWFQMDPHTQLVAHRPDRVAKIASRHGFELIHEYRPRADYIAQGFQLNR